MRTLVAVSIPIVEHNGKKMFLLPPSGRVGITDIRTDAGVLSHVLYIGRFGSWVPYPNNPNFWREVDTPCSLIRGGKPFDRGALSYVGSQENGFHIFDGFSKITIPRGTSPLVFMNASWFEVGDTIVFEQTPHPRTEAKRGEV